MLLRRAHWGLLSGWGVLLLWSLSGGAVWRRVLLVRQLLCDRRVLHGSGVRVLRWNSDAGGLLLQSMPASSDRRMLRRRLLLRHHAIRLLRNVSWRRYDLQSKSVRGLLGRFGMPRVSVLLRGRVR